MQLTDVPYEFYSGSAIAMGTDIYLLGGFSSGTTAYKYDTLTDTYTQTVTIPYSFSGRCACSLSDSIYLFGGNNYPTKVQVLKFTTKSFDDKSIVLLNGLTYKTQLLSNDLFDNSVKYTFNDVWLYEDENGLITDIPTYYGDGTQWINIKNPPVEEVEE